MPPDDVVERIRKLLRLAEDAGATEAEAAAALERASALLLRHNLSMDQVAVASGEGPPITEHPIRTGWAGSWRGTLLGILARHTLCSPIVSRQGKVDTVIVVGRPANVQATHALYDWIAAQLERFGLEEWSTFSQEQRAAVAGSAGIPWCPECEDWTPAYGVLGRRWCVRCATRVLPERPLIPGVNWKTAFYRGALLRIATRLAAQRKAQQQSAAVPDVAEAGARVTALVLRTDQENADYIRRRYGEPRQGRPRRVGYHAA
ncbi:MAG: DUF2786 domain-containing protein, partial [Acidimicrobiales bacterium]